jgi:hypothetical protein
VLDPPWIGPSWVGTGVPREWHRSVFSFGNFTKKGQKNLNATASPGSDALRQRGLKAAVPQPRNTAVPQPKNTAELHMI